MYHICTYTVQLHNVHRHTYIQCVLFTTFPLTLFRPKPRRQRLQPMSLLNLMTCWNCSTLMTWLSYQVILHTQYIYMYTCNSSLSYKQKLRPIVPTSTMFIHKCNMQYTYMYYNIVSWYIVSLCVWECCV